jgi:hypothetical protein
MKILKPSNQPYVYRMGTVRIRGIGTYMNRMHTKCMGEMYGVSPRDRFRKFANLNCFREYFSDRFKTCANSGISMEAQKIQIFCQLEIEPNFFTNFISISRTDIGTHNRIWLLGIFIKFSQNSLKFTGKFTKMH